MKEYNCRICGDEWNYFPKDFSKKYPHDFICPLCNMPWIDMVKDVYEKEGIKEVIRLTLIRIINNKK